MKRELIRSADGSNTLKLEESGESYHSVNGALAESRHIYIGCGLEYYYEYLTARAKSNTSSQLEINIFEMGLGTGLNCLLSAIYALKNQDIKIHYSCIEKYPVTNEEYRDLDHLNAIFCQQGDFSPYEKLVIKNVYETIQYSDWEKETELLPNFTLHKINSDLLTYKGGNKVTDIIYFDAFSPDNQPELWTPEVFKTLYSSLKTRGILVTYSSKGIVKQALRETGFDLVRLPGPKGKRHILRATRPDNGNQVL